MIGLEKKLYDELHSLSFHDGSINTLCFCFEQNEIIIEFGIYNNEKKEEDRHKFRFVEVENLSIVGLGVERLYRLEVSNVDTEKVNENKFAFRVTLCHCNRYDNMDYSSGSIISFHFGGFYTEET